ncbi:MAG: hypothetical protein ACRCX2_12585 [Paraclostridium sp.]
MEKFKKILTLVWYGVKAVLHLKENKEGLEKMDRIEGNFKK